MILVAEDPVQIAPNSNTSPDHGTDTAHDYSQSLAFTHDVPGYSTFSLRLPALALMHNPVQPFRMLI